MHRNNKNFWVFDIISDRINIFIHLIKNSFKKYLPSEIETTHIMLVEILPIILTNEILLVGHKKVHVTQEANVHWGYCYNSFIICTIPSNPTIRKSIIDSFLYIDMGGGGSIMLESDTYFLSSFINL